MGAAWVAGSTRGRLLARHRVGGAGAVAIASSATARDALARLADSPYAIAIAHSRDVEEAERDIWASVLWNLRVLAGWVPPSGVESLRVLAGFFEIRNLETLLLTGRTDPNDFELGRLTTAWTRARDAISAAEVRAALRRSAWRDCFDDDPVHILMCLRLESARRFADVRAEWGAAAAALVVARLIGERAQPVPADVARRAPELGRRAQQAETIDELVDALPDRARWAFEGVESASELWHAEACWWRRLDADAERMLRSARPGRDVVVGAAVALMADAWRTVAALEIASRGGGGREVLDAVA